MARAAAITVAVTLLSGVLLVQWMPRLPPYWCLGLLLLGAALLGWRFPRGRWLACVLLGIVWAAWRGGMAMDARLPRALEGLDFIVVGTISDLPQVRGDASSFTLRVEQATLDGKPVAHDIDPIGKNPISALEYYRNRDGRLRTKPKAPHPISPLVQGWLDSVTYSKLDFEKLPLDSCIEWLQKSSAKQTGEGPGVNFVLDRGVDAGEPITLHLINVPLLEALRYLSAVSGVEFSLDQYAISVKSAASGGGGLGVPEPATPEEINELESVMLPGLEPNHTPLDGVMQLLSRNTFSISNGKMQLCFVTEPGLNALAPVTLNVTNMPLTEALQYIGELANVDFVFQRYGIWVRRKTARD